MNASTNIKYLSYSFVHKKIPSKKYPSIFVKENTGNITREFSEKINQKTRNGEHIASGGNFQFAMGIFQS